MLLEEFKWKDEVLEAKEPVLVDFWAVWCPPCRMMNPIVESLARDFKVCKVNLDKNQPLAAHYRVSVVPTFLLFHEGKIAFRHEGIVSEETLRSEMTRFRD